MRTLIITPYYPPIISTLSIMMQELAEELRDKGHEVTVATAWLANKLTKQQNVKEFVRCSNENDVTVIRIKTPLLNSGNYFLRGLSQLLLPYLFWKAIRKNIKGIDAIVVYTPPLTLAIIGIAAKIRFQTKFILNVQDIFPQNAIDLGIMKNPLLIKFFEYLETEVYQSADQITTHTKGGLRFLFEKKNVPGNKLHLVTNWINTRPYRGVPIVDFRKRFLLGDRIVFLFAGVMGPSQNLNLLIEIATDIKRITDEICFLFVGEGTEKQRLMAMCRDRCLSNVIFKPLVPIKEYPDLLKAVDVGIVSLSSLNKTAVVPAKILGYMSASLPVFGILQRQSEGHDLIRKAKCGCSIVADQSVDYIAEAVIRFVRGRDRFSEYGKSGFMYVMEHFSKDACVAKLIHLMI